MEYARASQYEVIDTYADHVLKSRTDRRPEFQRMMLAVDKGQFQAIILYKSNRIACNMLNALAYEDKLARMYIHIVYVKEDFGNNAAGRFALRTMMNVNQFYSKNLSEDIMRGILV